MRRLAALLLALVTFLHSSTTYLNLVQGSTYVKNGERVEPYVECGICEETIDRLQTLLRSGNATYEEIFNATVEACYVLVPIVDWNPDALCDLAIDTYAPHIVYILNVTDKTPLEICTLYNNCDPPPRSYVPASATDNFRAKRTSGDGATGKMRQLSSDVAAKRAALKAANYNGTLKLVHITDVHTDEFYAEGSPTDCDMPLCCRDEYGGSGSARHWADHPCNIPHRTVELFFDFIAQQFEPIHILAYTGDQVAHTVWDQPWDLTVGVSEYITGLLANKFPSTASYYAVGNHDVYPSNLFYINRTENMDMNAIMFNHWKPLSGFGSEQQPTFERGAYYTVQYRAGLRVIAYNSMYGYLSNWYNILNVDEEGWAEMKQFLEDALAEAETNNEKVIFLGHHPTGSSGYVAEYSDFITDIHARYSDTIVLHVLGHTHGDQFSLVRDLTNSQTRGVQIVTPTMGSYSNNNPSLRVIYLDPDTFEPLDMDTYHMDVSTDADNPNPEIKFVYRATDEYGMIDISPESYEDLCNRMETNSTLVDKYRYNENTRVYVPGPCDQQCTEALLCDLRYSDYYGREECDANIP